MIVNGDDITPPSPLGEGQPAKGGQGGGVRRNWPRASVGDPIRARHAAFKRSRDMRKALTRQETKLWKALKTLRSDGFHFRRQAPFRGYYLDFVCFSRRLVLEADGAHHAHGEQAAHDEVRDAVLVRYGFTTLRSANSDVDGNFDGVWLTILEALAAAHPHPDRLRRSVPPHEGRED